MNRRYTRLNSKADIEWYAGNETGRVSKSIPISETFWRFLEMFHLLCVPVNRHSRDAASGSSMRWLERRIMWANEKITTCHQHRPGKGGKNEAVSWWQPDSWPWYGLRRTPEKLLIKDEGFQQRSTGSLASERSSGDEWPGGVRPKNSRFKVWPVCCLLGPAFLMRVFLWMRVYVSLERFACVSAPASDGGGATG